MAKKYPTIDPNASQEAEKYPHPIASRAFILEIIGAASDPLPLKTLLKKTGTPQAEGPVLLRRIRAMVRDGQLLEVPSGYAIAETVPLVDGIIQWRRNGDCLCMVDADASVIQLPSGMEEVFPGDRVRVQITRYEADGQRSGMVKSILTPVTPTFVGSYQLNENGSAVVEVFHRGISAPVRVLSSEGYQLKPQDYVVIAIEREPHARQSPRGRIVAHLGSPNQRGIATDVACQQFDLPIQWPDAVEKEAHALEKAAIPADPDRLDLRSKPFVTIDGEDARDFDDAIYCAPCVQGGWTLWVAIADVGAYVQPGSALDREAYQRGTSVYFPDRVVPMLPEILSNELCSLKPHVDRLALVCEMRINPRGCVTRSVFYTAIIRSHARLTYQQVQAVLDGDARALTHFADHVPHLQQVEQLYQQLILQRKARGAIDFESVETRIDLSETGTVVAVTPVERLTAHRIIEECMLCANVCAAKFLKTSGGPTVYRVHAAPSQEKWRDLRKFLDGMGIKPPKADPTPQNVTAFLQRIRGRADYPVLQTMVLRSMNQAIYTPVDVGHFGLAYETYLHFTSPIRRYPDLIAHRLIRYALRRKMDKTIPEIEDVGRYDKIAAHCSYTERRAEEASRDVQFALKCQYMLQHVGEAFSGIVVGVTHFGLFIQLENLYVEGMLHISAVDADYYDFDAEHMRWVGRTTGKTFQLGDRLPVRVAQVSVESRKIDLALILDKPPASRTSRRRKHGTT